MLLLLHAQCQMHSLELQSNKPARVCNMSNEFNYSQFASEVYVVSVISGRVGVPNEGEFNEYCCQQQQ